MWGCIDLARSSSSCVSTAMSLFDCTFSSLTIGNLVTMRARGVIQNDTEVRFEACSNLVHGVLVVLHAR